MSQTTIQSKKINKSERLMVGIPKGTEIYEFLENNGRVANWVTLNNMVKQLPRSKEDRAARIYTDFVERMSELYPESQKAFESLRPLFLKQIINKKPLDDWYYEEIKKL